MAAGKHIGKVLVQIRPEEDSKVGVPVPRLMQAYPRYFCNPSYSYIIAGAEHSYTFLPKSKKASMPTLTLWPAWCERVCEVQTCRFAVVGYLKMNILSFSWRRSQKVPSVQLGTNNRLCISHEYSACFGITERNVSM
jgi:hypothetical protein